MKGLIEKALVHGSRTAVVSDGNNYSYSELLERSAGVAATLLAGERDLGQSRVAFMARPGFEYVAMQWGIWRAGGIAVPLCLSYPLPSLAYVIEDADCDTVLVSSEYAELLSEYSTNRGARFFGFSQLNEEAVELPQIDAERDALILYTSGTTGAPKGVVTTHSNISNQISTLVDAWSWTSSDHILNVLPLHHVHGIINVMSCAFWSGATCEFLTKFEALEVFRLFSRGRINVFMAVPTIYFKLLGEWEKLDATYRRKLKERMQRFRLMVSGSAALPATVMDDWEKISGQRLLERYGMTETGMAISNPYRGERRAGHVGSPLPGVQVRLVDEGGKAGISGPGEIQVKGPGVFRAYWGREKETRDSFTADGWFRTGDIAEIKDGYYRILGRNSVDIIKSGGYKISALEIEEVSRKYPGISDCAVVGIPDVEWGEVIGIGIVAGTGFVWEDFLRMMREQVPSYKVPRVYRRMDDLPRNAMGKVTKEKLKTMLQ